MRPPRSSSSGRVEDVEAYRASVGGPPVLPASRPLRHARTEITEEVYTAVDPSLAARAGLPGEFSHSRPARPVVPETTSDSSRRNHRPVWVVQESSDI